MLNPDTEAERLYNEAHIRTRARVENVFGIWKRRFPILAYGCRLKIETAFTVVVATAVLHNIATKRGENIPNVENENDIQQLIAEGQILNVPHGNQNEGFQARRTLINNYFANL